MLLKKPREYQIECFNKAINALKKYNKALLVAPCGSGKSFMATLIIQELLKQGYKILFLVHLKTLIEQMDSEFTNNGLEHGVIKAGYPEDLTKHLQLGSVQTLNRRANWRSIPFDLIVLDEVHETIYNKDFRQYLAENPTKILGLTATPYRLKRSESLADTFDSEEMIIKAPTRVELMAMGYLVKETIYYSLDGADLSGVTTSMGDYKTPELSVVCNREDLIVKILNEYRDKGNNLPFLGFCVDINHAKNCTEIFQNAGINCALVTGETPNKERQKLFKDFDSGKLLGLFSVGVLSIGFDSPRARVGLMLRPTKSKSLWFQQVGRIERSCDNKPYSIILDQAGNTHRLGKTEWETEITLETLSAKPRKGEAPTRTCPICKNICHISQRECNNCFYQFPVKTKNKTYQKTELTKVADKALPTWFKDLPLGGNITTFDDCPLTTSNKQWFDDVTKNATRINDITSAVKSNARRFTLNELHWIAKQIGHKPGWAFIIYNYGKQSFNKTASAAKFG